MTLELGIGPLACTVKREGASFTASQPLEILSNTQTGLVARALGLSPAQVVIDTHAPIIATLGGFGF